VTGRRPYRRPAAAAADERGLTLIEFTMAAAVAGVMFLVLYSILNFALESYKVGQLRSTAVQAGRAVLNRIVTALRSAEDIYLADDDQILILRPIETSDPLALPEDRFRQDQVGYLYSAATGRLDRYLGTLGFDTFLDEIAAFSLNYRDSFYNLLAVPVADVQRIKFIEVALTLQEEDFQITLRNLVVLDNPVNVP